MFNHLLNSEHFNQDHILLSEDRDPIEFSGFSLMSLCSGTTGIAVQKANFYDVTNIDIAEFVADQIDGGGVLQKRYGNKTVTLTLFIQATSYDDLITRIDLLKRNTQGIEGELNILVRGETRTYKATCSGIRVPGFKSHSDFIEGIDIDFLITSPHWKIKAPNSTFIPSVVADFEKIIMNTGDLPTFPTIIIACKSSGNAITSLDITIKKLGELTGYTLTLAEAVGNGEVVIFDYEKKTVVIDDIEQNFAGVMTPLVLDYNVFDFQFTGTVNADIYISYNRTYL